MIIPFSVYSVGVIDKLIGESEITYSVGHLIYNNPKNVDVCTIMVQQLKTGNRRGRKMQNCLEVIFGEMHQMKVLGFFLEHPYIEVTQTTLEKYLKLHRRTIKSDLDSFESLGYISRNGERGPYRLVMNDQVKNMMINITSNIAHTAEKEYYEGLLQNTTPTWDDINSGIVKYKVGPA